jgi:hypothetical protein
MTLVTFLWCTFSEASPKSRRSAAQDGQSVLLRINFKAGSLALACFLLSRSSRGKLSLTYGTVTYRVSQISHSALDH